VDSTLAEQKSKLIIGNNGGRPATLTRSLAKIICSELSNSTKSLMALCSEHPEWPDYGSLRNACYQRAWFGDMMKRARQEQADHLVMDNIKLQSDLIANQSRVSMAAVQANKVVMEDRRWYASKVLKAQYGDDQSINVDARTAVVVGDEQLKELRGRLSDARKLVKNTGTKPVDSLSYSKVDRTQR
jgi:hypothetical protein